MVRKSSRWGGPWSALIGRSKLRPYGSDFARRNVRWLPAIVAVALLPKCLLCIAGYAAMLAGLGGAASELCGGAPDSGRLTGWASGVATTTVLLGTVGIVVGKRRKMSGTKGQAR